MNTFSVPGRGARGSAGGCAWVRLRAALRLGNLGLPVNYSRGGGRLCFLELLEILEYRDQGDTQLVSIKKQAHLSLLDTLEFRVILHPPPRGPGQGPKGSGGKI
jgi:hypothetical protein